MGGAGEGGGNVLGGGAECAVEGSERQADASVQTETNARVRQLKGGEATGAKQTVVETIDQLPSVRQATSVSRI